METPQAPRKHYAAVDVQLDDFELELFRNLEFQLIVNTDRTFWEGEDFLSNECLYGIETAIDCGFQELVFRYEGTAVSKILENARVVMQNAAFAAMNAPYPRDPDRHMYRVIENMREIYVGEVYPHLRIEMLMTNHHAHVMQRMWRKCISDPNHPACRRRLEYEFQNLLEGNDY